MDMQKIGSFLGQLRKEQGMTQEQLGEKLSVTNKTISRWETGTYMPPVEMLQMLSEMYGITINEILSGERLGEKEYRQKAEENIKVTLSASAFTWKEKSAFFKKKWLREHLFGLVVEAVFALALSVFCVWMDQTLLNALVIVGIVSRIEYHRNQMMIYIEDRAFDGSGSR